MNHEMMDGQMTINEWLGYPEYYDQFGCGDCNTCRFKFWKHKDGKAIQGCQCRGGSECHYEPKIEQACTTCTHYKTIVDAYTDKPLHKVCHKPGTCYGDMISDPDTHCCEYWEEKQCE